MERRSIVATAFSATIIFTGSAQKKSRPTTPMVPAAHSHQPSLHSWQKERQPGLLWKRQKPISMVPCDQGPTTISERETARYITITGCGNKSDNSPGLPPYRVIGKTVLLHKFRTVDIPSVKNNRMSEISFNHIKIGTAENKPLRQHNKSV
jgi:hypothetical protein